MEAEDWLPQDYAAFGDDGLVEIETDTAVRIGLETGRLGVDADDAW